MDDAKRGFVEDFEIQQFPLFSVATRFSSSGLLPPIPAYFVGKSRLQFCV